jgi:hypothetical protein
MSDWLIAVLIGAALGLLIGIKIARDSNARQPVRGGALAQTFHYLACSGLTGMLPFIITGIIVGLPALLLFGTAVGFLALTAVFLLLDAAIERGLPVSPGTGAALGK